MSGKSNGKTLRDIDPSLAGLLKEIKAIIGGVVGDAFRLYLFGSRARGDHEPDSDVDLMVLLPDELLTAETRDRIREVASEFSLEHECVLNVVITSEGLAREYTGFEVYGAVEREGVLV